MTLKCKACNTPSHPSKINSPCKKLLCFKSKVQIVKKMTFQFPPLLENLQIQAYQNARQNPLMWLMEASKRRVRDGLCLLRSVCLPCHSRLAYLKWVLTFLWDVPRVKITLTLHATSKASHLAGIHFLQLWSHLTCTMLKEDLLSS